MSNRIPNKKKRTKEDAIIENAEIASYKMLMEMADKAGLKDASTKLQQSLQEEVAMANFIVGNTPVLLSMLWPKLEAEEKEAPTTANAAAAG